MGESKKALDSGFESANEKAGEWLSHITRFAPPRQASILIVDDEDATLQLASVLLKKEGYAVKTALAASIAFEILKDFLPDLIISDWSMPKMNGPEFIGELRNTPAYKSIPIILLTALDESTGRQQGAEAGANAFIQKPFGRQELYSTIKNLLMLKQRESELTLIHNYLHDVFEGMADGLLVVGHDMKIQISNERFATLLGYTCDELVRVDIDTLFAKADIIAVIGLKNIVEKGTARQINTSLVSKSGKTLACCLNASIIYDAHRQPTGYILVVHDVQQMQEILVSESQAVARERRQLREHNFLLARIAAYLAHRVNNPLNVISLATHSIGDGVGAISNMVLDSLVGEDEETVRVKEFLQERFVAVEESLALVNKAGGLTATTVENIVGIAETHGEIRTYINISEIIGVKLKELESINPDILTKAEITVSAPEELGFYGNPYAFGTVISVLLEYCIGLMWQEQAAVMHIEARDHKNGNYELRIGYNYDTSDTISTRDLLEMTIEFENDSMVNEDKNLAMAKKLLEAYGGELTLDDKDHEFLEVFSLMIPMSSVRQFGD